METDRLGREEREEYTQPSAAGQMTVAIGTINVETTKLVCLLHLKASCVGETGRQFLQRFTDMINVIKMRPSERSG